MPLMPHHTLHQAKNQELHLHKINHHLRLNHHYKIMIELDTYFVLLHPHYNIVLQGYHQLYKQPWYYRERKTLHHLHIFYRHLMRLLNYHHLYMLLYMLHQRLIHHMTNYNSLYYLL